jgi:hypothetical protein
VLAGAAALLAGALAKAAERVARAADGEPLLLGRENAATGTTVLAQSSSTPADVLRVTTSSGVGVAASGGATGVSASGIGPGSSGVGVFGFGGSTGVVGAGIFAGGTGVVGTGTFVGSTGVRGTSIGASGTGVIGSGPVGVRGEGGATGVVASTTSSAGTGLRGETTDGIAVDGAAFGAGHGVVGFSQDHIGVTGQGGSFGVYGTSPGLAGRFDGAVEVNGPLVVRGDLHVVGPLAASVASSDGALRRLHPLASPEAWLEDFGAAQLVAGQAQVRLDPEFAALVRGDAYHVFLTPEGDSRGLYVSGKGPAGFAVQEQQGGTSGLPFAYRVVAKRRDAAGRRGERVALPPVRPVQVPAPPARAELPELPPLPEVPEVPGVPPGPRKGG